jgi:membrane-associated phospholipid phosphatase
MPRALRISAERTLPKGWADVLRQVGMFAAAYLAYRLVETVVNVSNANPAPFIHARDLISLERGLGVFVEPAVQSWAYGSHLLMVVATYVYITAQTFILFGLLLYLYLRHNRSYYFVRNMMFVAMCLALVGYTVFPTAPPRFLPNWGFVDTVSQITNTSPRNNWSGGFVNPYAAVPSMHVAFAAMLGWTLVFLVRNWVARVWWALWPLLITAVTVITANHFLIDAVLGLATAAIAASVAFGLARKRPHVWAFRPRPATVTRRPAAAPQPAGFAAAPSAVAAQTSAFASQPAGAVAQSARSVVSS